MHATGSFLKVAATGVAHSDDADQRHTNASQAEAEHGPPNIFTSGLAHGHRENQVTGTEEEGKEH